MTPPGRSFARASAKASAVSRWKGTEPLPNASSTMRSKVSRVACRKRRPSAWCTVANWGWKRKNSRAARVDLRVDLDRVHPPAVHGELARQAAGAEPDEQRAPGRASNSSVASSVTMT